MVTKSTDEASLGMRVGCSSCSPGQGPTDGAEPVCATCTGAMNSAIGQCQECASPNVVSEDRVRCYACDPGHGPNDARTACTACAGTAEACEGALDTNGGSCALSSDRASCRPDLGADCV